MTETATPHDAVFKTFLSCADTALLQDKLASLFILGHTSGQQITVLVNYLMQAGQAQDVQKLLYGLAQRVPQHGEKLMTMAE